MSEPTLKELIERATGPRQFTLIGYNDNGEEYTRLTIGAASASIETVRINAPMFLFDCSGRRPASFEVVPGDRLTCSPSTMRAVLEGLEEINRDAWSDDRTRMRVIARTSDELLALLNRTENHR